MSNGTHRYLLSSQDISDDLSFDRFKRQTRDIARGLVHAGDKVVDLSCNDLSLLSTINHSVNGDISIIGYSQDLSTVLEARELFSDKKQSLFFNESFNGNMLKNNSTDLIVGNNVLGAQSGTKRVLREIRRVLKHGGLFFFKELISFDKPRPGFITYFKKRDGHVFNSVIFNIQERLPVLRFLQFDIKIIGNGNFYFNGADISSLQEFCDIIGMRTEDRSDMLSQILYVCIYGTIR